MLSSEVREIDLYGFKPDCNRAALLNKRVTTELASSLRILGNACDGKIDFDRRRFINTCAEIESKPLVDSIIFALYYDLFDAIKAGDRLSIEDVFKQIEQSTLDAGPFRTLRWSDEDLGCLKAERFHHYVIIKPGSAVDFKKLSVEAYMDARGIAQDALNLLQEIDREIVSEICEFIRELVFVAGAATKGLIFDGANSFYCWGALFLNADRHSTIIDMVDGLAHECAHSQLFGMSMGKPYVLNAPEERYPSPLRSDLRPLDGIFHAAYVSARIHYVHGRLLDSGFLDSEQERQAEELRDFARQAFYAGRQTIDKHAKLTKIGQQVFDNACHYMWTEDMS